MEEIVKGKSRKKISGCNISMFNVDSKDDYE